MRYKELFVFNLKKSKKKKKQAKGMNYPMAIERAYSLKIQNAILEFQKRMMDYIQSNLSSFLKGDSFNIDVSAGRGFLNSIAILEGFVREAFPDDVFASTMWMGITGVGEKLNSWTDKEWQKEMDEVLGHEFGVPKDWWIAVRDKWGKDNYKLIKSLAETNIREVNDIVEKAIANGWGYSDVIADIKKVNAKISTSKVKLIARDQIGKLNGQITQRMHEEVGIAWYTWRTANDERVRGNPAGKYPKAIPSHWIMEGLLCDYNDSSIYSDDKGKTWKNRTGKMPLVHPGQAIQCRCTSIGYYGNLEG